jgi:hypothetical protein
MSTTDAPIAQQRLSSVIHCEKRSGRSVYVKEYTTGVLCKDSESIRARAAREIDVIERLAVLEGMGGRLGVLRIVEADPGRARLVTEAIPGRSLHDLLLGPFRRRVTLGSLKALFLAGRWLRVFQTLPIRPGDERLYSSDAPDLVAYCLSRFDAVRAAGSHWATRGRRERISERLSGWLAGTAAADRQPTWSHGDYLPGNLVWDGRVLTALDFPMCRLDLRLSDVAYFVHRLEMLPLQFPWKDWPIRAWKRAFLAGYGERAAGDLPIFRALATRHLLCRLISLTKIPGEGPRRRMHSAWLRYAVTRRLNQILS